MGVYHVSGLGISPGALTMPLSIVYILQAGAQLGIKEAKDFFAGSGERERKGSYEKIPGLPEYVIVFDSPDAIEGRVKLRYKSKWFGMENKGNHEKIERPIVKYIKNLISHLEREFLVDLKPPKKLYLVRTDHQSFEDAFYKMGITLEGLKRKEVWLNLIGGTNQMNLALLLSGAYSMVPSRYYYVFQNNEMLEPSWIKRPSRKTGLESIVKDAISRWYDLPPLDLERGSILRKLHEKFRERDYISKSELVLILSEGKEGNQTYYDEKFIPKLIGARYIVSSGNDIFKKGEMLDKVFGIFEEIEKTNVKNFSSWQKWAEGEGILEEADFNEV